jgi:hypothetical protein
LVRAVNTEAPPSLLGITIRRSFQTGRFFLGYGTVISMVLGVALAASGGGTAFAASYPFLLPIFVVVGSMGGMVVFTNDRTKGVLEYLLAYGFSPQRLFVNFLLTALALASVILTAALTVGVGVYVALGHPLTIPLAILLAAYAIPMSYACVAFGATIGMFWTSLSSPRAGMNSPLGLIPFIGILPSLVTLFLITTLAAEGIFSPTELRVVEVAVVAGVVILVLALLSAMGRFLRRERLLSPA